MRFLLTGLTCALAVSLAASEVFIGGALFLVVAGLPLASAAAATSRSALTGVAAGIAFGFGSGHAVVSAMHPKWLDDFYDGDVVDMMAFGVVLGLGLVTAWLLAGRTKLAIGGVAVLSLSVATAYGIAFAEHLDRANQPAWNRYSVAIPDTIYFYREPVFMRPEISVVVGVSLVLLWIAHRLGGLEAVRWTLLGIGLSPAMLLGYEAAVGTLLAGLAGAVTGAFLDKTGATRLPWEAVGAVAVAVGIAYRPLAIFVTAGAAFAFSYGYVRTETALKKIRSDNIIPLALGGAALVTVGTMLVTVPTPAWALSALSVIAAILVAAIALHTWVIRAEGQTPSPERGG